MNLEDDWEHVNDLLEALFATESRDICNQTAKHIVGSENALEIVTKLQPKFLVRFLRLFGCF